MDAHTTILEQEALLHITGPESLDFLQGQTTCDTRLVNAAQASPGAYCTPKGRVVCDFLLVQLGDEHVALRMRRGILEHAAAVLGKYILFSKAEAEAAREDWQVSGCWGAGAAAVLDKVFGGHPDGQYGAVAGEGFALVQVDAAGEQFECFIDIDAKPELASALAQACETGSETAWQSLAIAAGVGRVEAQTIEEFVPQMLNYDRTGHISFTKGCYTGQEVVARLHYRGTPKRRMYRAGWAGAEAVEPGTGLYTADGNQGVGTVVNATTTGDRVVALVTSTEDGIAAGLHLGESAGVPVSTEAPPYPLVDE